MKYFFSSWNIKCFIYKKEVYYNRYTSLFILIWLWIYFIKSIERLMNELNEAPFNIPFWSNARSMS